MPADRIVVDGLGRLPQFAHAGRAGDAVHVSGTLGTTDGLHLADGIAAQTRQTLENLATILSAAGRTWDDVAKVSVYLTDLADFGAMNDAYSDYFGDVVPPARITIGGCDLALGALVEMECVADARATSPPQRVAEIGRRQVAVEHDGETLHVEVAGEEHRDRATPLVLCHGLGGNHAVWFQQITHFAVDRMVVAWDHRGFGRSTDHADRSGPEVAAGDLLAVCDALDIAQADLVGQSMGGWSIVGAALERPGLVRSMVLADTLGGVVSDEIVTALRAPRRHGAPAADGVIVGVHPAIDRSLLDRDPARAHLYQLLGGFGTIDPDTLIERLMATTHDADEAAQLTCPVLCIVGERDPLMPPASIRALAALLPDVRVTEIPGSGHSPYFEDPEAWNLVVRRFLDTIDHGRS